MARIYHVWSCRNKNQVEDPDSKSFSSKPLGIPKRKSNKLKKFNKSNNQLMKLFRQESDFCGFSLWQYEHVLFCGGNQLLNAICLIIEGTETCGCIYFCVYY